MPKRSFSHILRVDSAIFRSMPWYEKLITAIVYQALKDASKQNQEAQEAKEFLDNTLPQWQEYIEQNN